jgi:hypothetical protein
LQKVKYEPDTAIVFPDKRLLYKKEEDGKVIPFRWKALAAAVLLGLGLWTGISYLKNGKPEKVIVTNQGTKPKNIPAKQPEQKNDDKNFARTDESKKQPLQIIEPKKLDNPVKKQQQDVAVKNIQPVIKPQELAKLPEPKKEDIAVLVPTNKTEVVKPSNDLPKPGITSDAIDKPAAPVVRTNDDAQYASYIADAEVKNENYVFYNITAEEFRKSKIGNFLKKAKRVIENKIPFRGKGLKIGNVEIAKDEQN